MGALYHQGLVCMNDVAARVTSIVIEHMGVYADQVTPEARFIEDLGGDSLDVVELVMAFEDEFGVTIVDADIDAIITVQDAITYIETAQQARPGSA
ncbi:Acyl carrier protein OS=Sphingobium scionense OX=1404341 GN=acpP PE=3 SV=1 [Sphingobium scionense]